MTAAEVGNRFAITQETTMDLDYLNIAIIICYIQLTLTCLIFQDLCALSELDPGVLGCIHWLLDV